MPSGYAADPPFRVEFKNPDDSAVITRIGPDEPSSTQLEIRSESGIGECTVRRHGDHWPERLVLRFSLRGLEQLTIRIGDRKWLGSVSSHDGSVRWSRFIGAGSETPIATTDPEWCPIRIADSSGSQPIRVPLGEKERFEIPIPTLWFADNPESVRVAWIDFYR